MICTLCNTNETHADALLCHTCTRTLSGHLTRLPRMWAALEAWLAPGGTGAPAYGGRSRPAHAPLPLREDVLSLRAAGGICGILEDWRAAMQQERGWGQPVLEASLARRVTVAARALDHNLDWIADWDQAAVFAAEIRQLVHRARSAVQPPERARATFIGLCVAVDRSGVVCGAELWAQPGQRISCSWCLCPYPPDTWLTLIRYQPDRAQDEDVQGLENAAA